MTTEKETENHYFSRKNKPNYSSIKTDSSDLHVVSFGKTTNPPILFIHGAPGSWNDYFSILDDTLLINNFHLIAIDRPGYGKSKFKRKKDEFSIEKQANEIVKSLEINHSGQKGIVIGRSYGAPVAGKIAFLYPEKTAELLLVSPAIDPKSEKFWFFSRFGKSKIIRSILPNSFNQATDEKYNHIQELQLMEDNWEKIKSNTTVYFAGKDKVISQKNFDFAKIKLGKNPLNNFIFLKNSNHMISNSNPQIIINQLLSLIKK